MKRNLLMGFGLAVVFAVAGALAADKESKTSEQACGCCCAHKCCGATSAVVLGETEKAEKAKDPLAGAKCPVSGEEISKDSHVDYKGGKLYFCCNGCAAKFQKDKAKYAIKANYQLVATGQAKQKGCPLSGGKLNAATKTKVCGVDVAFCCNHCQAKVKEAKEEKQLELVFGGKNFDKAFEVKNEVKKD